MCRASGCSVYRPVGSRGVYLPVNRNQSYLTNKFTNGQTLKNARNSNFSSANCCVPNLLTRTMVTKERGFTALLYRTSSAFEDRLNSISLQFLRTLVLFFVLLAGFSCWVFAKNSSCNLLHSLFSLEQSRVVDLTVAEDHPDSILESNVLSFEVSQLLLRRMSDFSRQFCQIA